MKSLLLIFFIISYVNAFSQDIDKIQKDFDVANTLYESGEYTKADSLFTEIIHEYPNKGAFFNRAHCKQKLGNMNGYCQDLQIAAFLYEDKAAKIVCDECYRIVTNYYDKENQLTNKKGYKFKEVIKIMKYDTLIYVTKTRKSGIFKSEKIISEFVIQNKKDTICFNENGKILMKKPIEEKIDTVNEKMPIFPKGNAGLMEYMQSEIKYPKRAKSNNIQGTVYIYFEIDKQGYVRNIKTLRFIKLGLTEEAIKAIAYMPKWKPGTKNGKPVSVKFTYPVKFKLQ